MEPSVIEFIVIFSAFIIWMVVGIAFLNLYQEYIETPDSNLNLAAFFWPISLPIWLVYKAIYGILWFFLMLFGFIK